MTKTDPTVKAKRGRPKKAAENPDCEVASKGYVKRVARRMTDLRHTHYVSNADQMENIGITTIGLSVFSACLWLIARSGGLPHLETMFASIFWVSVCICITCVASDCKVDVKSNMMSDNVPDYLEKYEPPCERKKECE